MSIQFRTNCTLTRHPNWHTVWPQCNFMVSIIKRLPAQKLFFRGAYIRNYTVVKQKTPRIVDGIPFAFHHVQSPSLAPRGGTAGRFGCATGLYPGPPSLVVASSTARATCCSPHMQVRNSHLAYRKFNTGIYNKWSTQHERTITWCAIDKNKSIFRNCAAQFQNRTPVLK